MAQVGPARQQPSKRQRSEDIVAEVVGDEELMWQVRESIEEKRRGDSTIPFHQIVEEAKRRRSA